jgi:glycosyltransferase involved in cell wall biosynthesis
MNVGILAQLLSFKDGYRQAGVSRYIEYLLRYLPEVLGDAGRVTAFVGDGADNPDRMRSFAGSVEFRWTRWPTGKIPVRILWEQLVAPMATTFGGIDVVHGPVNIVPVGGRLPSVVTIHDLAFLEYPEQYPAMQRRYLEMMTRASARKAHRVITVSDYTGLDVAARLGVSRRKIVTVPNGVSEEFYPRQGSADLVAFRQKMQLPEEFLLFVGTLQPRKNLIGLLRAFARVPRAQRLPLYVVGGEGWMYSSIFDEVARLGIANEVQFPGYAASETLPLWYSAATAFIYPSYYEGFGLPVLEAMACGTPVITSNRSSLPEVVGDAGVLTNPDDPEDIADKLVSLLDDSEQRAKLATSGRERASTFTWQRTARETARVYRDVVSEG